MEDNDISLMTFLTALAVEYPRDHRRMQEIMGQMYHNLVADIESEKERIARKEANRRSLALLRNILAEQADASTPPSRKLSPPPGDQPILPRRHANILYR